MGPFSCQFKNGHALDMSSVGKHIQDACKSTPVARLMNQHLSISSKRSGIAADIHNPGRKLKNIVGYLK